MGARKQYTGEVVSDKMEKTAVVRVMHMSKHSKYGKSVKQYNKFKAHNDNNAAKIGDTVVIEETRPLSKEKRFRIVNIVKKAAVLHVAAVEEKI